jgi:hypothetical protein
MKIGLKTKDLSVVETIVRKLDAHKLRRVCVWFPHMKVRYLLATPPYIMVNNKLDPK